MKTSEILFKARDIQLERGRAKGVFEARNGSVCMIGALRVACGLPTNLYLFDEGYMNAARTVRYIVDMLIPDFSDLHCKTAEDMATVFEIAACCAVADGN